jgi:hypothetical protein
MRSSTHSFPLSGQVPRPDDCNVRLPRLPVLGWATFAGPRHSRLPCILDRPDLIFTSSGRAAIAFALRDLQIGPGDDVLVPTYHCTTMIAPVVAAGARPLFFPIDAAGAPRLDVIANMRISRARAIIVAHYFGLPQPMTAIRRFCDEHRIALIEDCAHAMFGQNENRPVGTSGDYAIASLTKFLPTTDGGCLVGRRRSELSRGPRRSAIDELRAIANAVELGAQHRRIRGLNGFLGAGFAVAKALRGTPRSDARGSEEQEDAADPAQNPLADFDAGLWCNASIWSRFIARSAHRERITALRRRNYRHLAALVADIPGTRVPWPELPEFAAPYVFPLWVDAPAKSYQAVRRAGIPVFRWDYVWPGVPMIAGDHGAEWAVHIFQLGCHQDLGLDDLGVMADTLRQILSSVDR